MSLALFGISDGPLNLAVSLLVLFLVVVWLALVYWTFMDARRRIADPILIACATAASLFPYVGSIIYVILRPPEFLDDAREQALETRAAELRVRQLVEQACPSCEYPVDKAYLRCPSCHTRLKNPCPSCSKPLDPRWSMCPFCETPVQARGRRPAAQDAPADRPESVKASAAPTPKKEPAREQQSRRRRPATEHKEPAAEHKEPAAEPKAKPARPARSSEEASSPSAAPRSGARRTNSGREASGDEQKRPTPAS